MKKRTAELIKVSLRDWNAIHDDYKGIWHAYFGEKPEWLGRRVVTSTCITHDPNEPCCVLVEGVHFVIEE